MNPLLDTQVNSYRELRRRLPHLEGVGISQMILAAAIEKAGDRIAQSIDTLEIVIRTKKPL